jgi:hypothetical protein
MDIKYQEPAHTMQRGSATHYLAKGQFSRRLFHSGAGLLSLFLCISVCLKAQPPRNEGNKPTLEARIGKAPPARRHLPLMQALATIGVSVAEGYVLFGVEIRHEHGAEPVVDLALQPGANVEDELRRLFEQLPQYSFTAKSNHFVSIYPKAAMTDPDDPLNLRVKRFDVDGAQAGLIFTWPELFVPELKEKLTPGSTKAPNPKHVDLYVGPVAVGPLVTLHLRNVTVREILDAASQATEGAAFPEAPLGWSFAFDPKSISAGGVVYWRLFMTLPHNWGEQARRMGTHAP